VASDLVLPRRPASDRQLDGARSVRAAIETPPVIGEYRLVAVTGDQGMAD